MNTGGGAIFCDNNRGPVQLLTPLTTRWRVIGKDRKGETKKKGETT
jgi:hypothetical protein